MVKVVRDKVASPPRTCHLTLVVLPGGATLPRRLNQSVDFYSGLSGATTARTTRWMMSAYDRLNNNMNYYSICYHLVCSLDQHEFTRVQMASRSFQPFPQHTGMSSTGTVEGVTCSNRPHHDFGQIRGSAYCQILAKITVARSLGDRAKPLVEQEAATQEIRAVSKSEGLASSFRETTRSI